MLATVNLRLTAAQMVRNTPICLPANSPAATPKVSGASRFEQPGGLHLR